MATIRNTRLGLGVVLAAVALVGAGLFVTNELRTTAADDGSQTPGVPSPAEAEALLTEAHRLAQEPNHRDLCQTIAQNAETCQRVLKWAEEAHVRPSADRPSILEDNVAENTAAQQGARVLRIRGTLADGRSYTGKFSAVRTTAGEIRSQNAVYWYSDFATISSSFTPA
ncbi:hypothetical protein ABZ345_16935 [Lentzea sp. NPDC005914]|uniref:hypothetical protein n=1 Tax=Lentzea sp. NPDC005914 TaxID=3154572 RepID=UPI0033F37EA7